MRWLSGRNATKFIQSEVGNRISGQLQVPDMHRIKSTAENTDQLQIGCAWAAPSLSGNTSL